MLSLYEYREKHPKHSPTSDYYHSPWDQYNHETRRAWLIDCLEELRGEVNESNVATKFEELCGVLLEEFQRN